MLFRFKEVPLNEEVPRHDKGSLSWRECTVNPQSRGAAMLLVDFAMSSLVSAVAYSKREAWKALSNNP